MAKAQVFKDERGKNYVIGGKGERLFLAPIEVVNGRLTRTDPSGKSSFFTNKEWDAHTGTYKSSRNWSNIVSLGALAAIGTPAALAVAGGAGGAAGGGIGLGGPSGFGAITPAMAAAAPTSAAAAAAAGTGATVAGTSGFWSPSTLKLLELGIGSGTNIYGNRAAANADRERGAREDASAAEALAFLKHQDELDRAQYQEERARLWGHQDIDRTRAEEDRQLGLRREGEREARLAPLRGGSGAFATLNDLAGLRPGGGGGSTAPPVSVRASDWNGAYATGPGRRIDDGPLERPVDENRPFSTTMPVGRRRPPITLAELAKMRTA